MSKLIDLNDVERERKAPIERDERLAAGLPEEGKVAIGGGNAMVDRYSTDYIVCFDKDGKGASLDHTPEVQRFNARDDVTIYGRTEASSEVHLNTTEALKAFADLTKRDDVYLLTRD